MKYIKTFEKFSLFQKLFGNDDKSNTITDNNQEGDIKMGSRGENVKELQKNLEELGFKLYSYGVDGIFGLETKSTILSLFEHLKKLPNISNYVEDLNILNIDNNIISVEQQDLIRDLADNDNLKNEIENHFNEMEKEISNMDVLGKKEIYKNIINPEEFIIKLNEISKRLQISPKWLEIVLWKESKFNPKAINKDTGASGLLQFMPTTAQGLGTSVEEIRNMSGIEQLDIVYKYFKRYTGKIHSLQDLYLITFFPAAMGKDDDYILQTKKTSAETIAKQNPAVDINKDGEITKGEFDDYVVKDLPRQWKKEADKKYSA